MHGRPRIALAGTPTSIDTFLIHLYRVQNTPSRQRGKLLPAQPLSIAICLRLRNSQHIPLHSVILDSLTPNASKSRAMWLVESCHGPPVPSARVQGIYHVEGVFSTPAVGNSPELQKADSFRLSVRHCRDSGGACCETLGETAGDGRDGSLREYSGTHTV